MYRRSSPHTQRSEAYVRRRPWKVNEPALQRRYAAHSLRIEQTIPFRIADLRKYWNELELWEVWCCRGHAEETFPSWLDLPIEADSLYRGTTRRDGIEFAMDVIKSELPVKL